MRIKKKTILLGLSALLFIIAIYAGSYLYLTITGQRCLSQTGKLRYGMGLSVSDISEWRPKGLWWQYPFKDIEGKNTSRGNGWGYFYSPLIYLDQRLWHKTEIIIKTDLEPTASGNGVTAVPEP